MTRYILQRLLLLPFLLLVYSFVIFAIIHAPPGDFLTSYVATLTATGTSITADQINALRHEYGLDQPFVIQYLYWLRDLLHGNFGLSLEYQRPNADLIKEQLGLTVALAAMAFVFAAETAYHASQHSLHVHGGYGFTDEYDIQLYYRRAKAWAAAFADPRRELLVVADRRFGPAITEGY